MTTRTQMCLNAAERLQREAYQQQVKGRKTPLKQFTPCEKGLVYTAEIRAGNLRPQSLVSHDAALADCACHRSLSENDLIEYELPSEKELHANQ